jgi:hypothetical protein
MKFYFFIVNYNGKNESGYILTPGDRVRVVEMLLETYGAGVELREITETNRDQYNQYIKQKYEPNTKHMQEIPYSLPGWKVRDN